MKVKVFEKNENGKIEFTRKELEALLNEIYNDGHSDGYQAGRDSKTYTWTSPTWTYLSNTTAGNTYMDNISTPLSSSNIATTSMEDNSTLKISYGN